MLRVSDFKWLKLISLSVVVLGLASCGEGLNPLGLSPSFDLAGRQSGNPLKPWTGRSGSAAITAYALFGQNGLTNLTVTSYAATDAAFATPVGCIDKIQVKVYDARARLVSTQNFNHLDAGSSVTVQVRGAQVGYRLSIKVNVSCIDGRRTDVVTADVAVIQPDRTDPAVIRLGVPGTPLTSEPVPISAYVQVPLGLAAASGNCALYVDGVPAGTLAPVTVAAGDSVPCVFTRSFPTEGTVRVTVAFENVTPTDLNPANNTASTDMPVYSEPPTVEFTANLYDDTVAHHDFYTHSLRVIPDAGKLYDTLPDPLPGMTVAQTVDSLYPLVDTAYSTTDVVGNIQHAQVVGIVNTRVAFPLAAVSVSQRSGTTTYHEQAWSNVGTAGAECAALLQGTVTLSICAYPPQAGFPNGKTVITYVRHAESAAQRLVEYRIGPDNPASSCDPASTDTDDQCYTVTTPEGEALVPYSETYEFTLLLQDRTHRFSATVGTTLSMARTLISDAPPAFYDVQNDESLGLLRWREAQGEVTDRLRYSGPIASIVKLTETLVP